MIFNSPQITQLVKQWQHTKSQELLEQIMTGCTPLAEVIACQFSDDGNYRDDLIQECMLRLPAALPHYDPDLANLHKYLTSVFRNRCISYVSLMGKQDKLAVELIEQGVQLVAHSRETSNILQELTVRNRLRFPSLDVQTCDALTAHVYEFLLEGSQPGYGQGVIKEAMANYTHLTRHKILVFYHSTLAYLRMTYEDFALLDCKEPDEFSLMQDVMDVLGEEAHDRLLLVFAGMNLKVPN